MVKLYIAYDPPAGGDPMTLACVADRTVLVLAARAAISESRARTQKLASEDQTLGILQSEEGDRLERALSRVVPELRVAAGHTGLLV